MFNPNRNIMKKLMLILAIGTLSYATVQATASPLSYISVEQHYQDDKVEIDQDDLPKPVKDAVLNDSEVGNLEISKVYQVTKDNELFYKIKFDGGDQGEVTKKYDATGQEIKKDKLLKEPVSL